MNLTITEFEGELHVNDAKIIIRDLLIANGVIHITDKALDESDPGVRPQLNDITVVSASNATGSGSDLSTGAKANIGVGAAIAVLGFVAIVAVFLRRRRANGPANGHERNNALEIQNRQIHEKYSRKLPHELITKSYDAPELEARSRAHELDGKMKSHTDASTTEASSS